MAEPAGLAGEHQQPLLPTVGTSDAGKPAHRITAVQVALNHLLDDASEEHVFLLEPSLVFPKEPLEIIKEQEIDLLVTDLNMPNMNGIELIKAIRANPSYKFLPVIMLTTDSQGDIKAQGRAAGATGWIVKPFNPEQLLGVVKKVLG